ncbi:MAG: pitrilysin family protein [Pseudomonadota bacterium]
MSQRARITLLLAALLVTLPAAAAPREPVPPMGTPRALTLPAKREFSLANGMQVTFVPFGTVPKTAIMLNIGTGNVADGDKNGLADLVAQLLKHGAGARDTEAVANLAAELGGELDAGTSVDQFGISLDVLAEHATDAVELLADVVRRPRLPSADLQGLKSSMKRNLAISRSQPQAVAGEAFSRLRWGDTVYGRGMPSDAQIDSMTLADVQAFISSEFGARRAHLYVAGQFDAAAVEATLRRAFGDWAAGPAPRHQAPSAMGGQVVQLIDRPGAKQSTVLLGRAVAGPTQPRFMDLSVANALFGGTPLLSRLDRNLREDKGYTYGVNSHLIAYRNIAGWTLAADVNTADTAAALTEVFAELARLRTVEASAEELRAVQNYRAGNFLIGASSRQGLIGQLQFLQQQELGDDWLVHYVDHLNAVTPADVRRAASESLDPRQMVLVIVGDLAKIKPAILALQALQGAEFR